MIDQLPQFAGRAARFHHRALSALAQITAGPYHVHAYPLPGPANEVMPAGAPVEIRLSLPIGSYVVGLSGSSSESAGFDLQITDLRHNAPFFSQVVNWQNVTSQAASPEGIATPLVLLPKPRLVIEPAVLSVKIRNRAAAANTVELVVFTLEPNE